MKRLSPRMFARAFFSSAKAAPDRHEAAQTFAKIIRRKHCWSQREKILKELEAIVRQSHHRSLIIIESARKLDSRQRDAITAGYPDADVREVVNPDLIAGIRLRLNDIHLLDASLRRVIKTLFSG